MVNDIRVGRSTIAGKGLFATKPLRSGERICEYTGKLYRRYTEPANRYLVEVNGHWTVDGSAMSNLGRWANHSCKPNAELVVGKGKRIWCWATRRIKLGEEIFINYGEEYVDQFLKPSCRCSHCRGAK